MMNQRLINCCENLLGVMFGPSVIILLLIITSIVRGQPPQAPLPPQTPLPPQAPKVTNSVKVNPDNPKCGITNCKCGCKEDEACSCATSKVKNKPKSNSHCECSPSCTCGCNNGYACQCNNPKVVIQSAWQLRPHELTHVTQPQVQPVQAIPQQYYPQVQQYQPQYQPQAQPYWQYNARIYRPNIGSYNSGRSSGRRGGSC